MYIFIPSKKEDGKTEYDKNNGKIVSLTNGRGSWVVGVVVGVSNVTN